MTSRQAAVASIEHTAAKPMMCFSTNIYCSCRVGRRPILYRSQLVKPFHSARFTDERRERNLLHFLAKKVLDTPCHACHLLVNLTPEPTADSSGGRERTSEGERADRAKNTGNSHSVIRSNTGTRFCVLSRRTSTAAHTTAHSPITRSLHCSSTSAN